MVTLAIKILRISRQKALILSLLCLVFFWLSIKVSAQQAAKAFPVNVLSQSSITSPSSPPIEDRIRELEQKVQYLENKPKDFSDMLNAASTLVSGLVIALIGYWATNAYKQREIAIAQVQAVRDFMPQIQSEERRDVQAALALIGFLGNPDIVAELAAVYQNELVAIAALSKLASSQNRTVKRKAQRSLDTLLKSFNLTVISQRFHDLASEYELTRDNLPVGNQKTQKMEAIFTAMKGLAPAGLPLLPHLINSNSLGDWLSAIAILQEKPSPDYLVWLANKIAEDPGAFHGYHAAVALRKAVDVFGEEKVKPAIRLLRNLVVGKAGGQDLLKKDAFKVLRPPEPDVLKWAKNQGATNPYNMGPRNYERCSYDLEYPGWEHDLIHDEKGNLKYQ